MSASRLTSLIGEDTDLVLSLFHTDVSKCTALHFRSDKVKSYVYNIKVLKQVLGEAVCNDLLFLHAFTVCDSLSRVFGIGKKSAFQRIIKREKTMKDYSKASFRPKKTQDVEKTNGSKAMIVLFNGDQKDSLASIRYNMLRKKVVGQRCTSGQNDSSQTPLLVDFILRTYYQVMEWMGCSDEMAPSEWGWKVEGHKLVPVMTDKSPPPDELIQMIHCNCLEGYYTLRCISRRHVLECTRACGHCQDGNSDNMKNAPVIDDDEDEEEEVWTTLKKHYDLCE